MKDNETLPTSIVAQINDAKALASLDGESDAQIVRANAELAAKDPGAYALVSLAQSGYRKLTKTETVEEVVDTPIRRSLLGIDFGTAIKPLKSSRTTVTAYKVR